MNAAIVYELRMCRLKKGLEIGQVAENFGISYETMRRYEKGHTNITIEFLEKLLDFYGVDISIFFKNVCEYMHEIKINEE